jgi:hypothetical protein
MTEGAGTLPGNVIVEAKSRRSSPVAAAAEGGFPKSAYFWIVAIYTAITSLTTASFQGDTPYYILSIENYSGRDFLFWDFGHLLWRPLIWVLLHTIHPVLPAINTASLILTLMTALNWAAGLGCVLLMAQVARKFVGPSLAFLAALTLAVSQVFLNYLHTGLAYIPGLFFLLLALDLVSSKGEDRQTSWLESTAFGLALALAVLFWLPYVFVLPALFLFPFLMRGFKRGPFSYALRAVAMCAVVGLGAYGIVAMKLGLSSAADFKEWVAASSHSVEHLRGLTRAAFGFVRSWLEMGNVGIEFKRFLLHDPYAPVSAASLLFAGTWKLILTYVLLGTIALKLLLGSERDRRMLIFLLVAFLPVFAFGIKWQGGDMERYIAAFPALILAGACAMNSRPAAIARVLGVLFVCALAIVNVSHDLRWVQEAQQRALLTRANALASLPEGSYVVFLPVDPLFSFVSFASVVPGSEAPVRPLNARVVVTIGSSHVVEWREDFASTSLTSWQNGKEVWICRGLLESVPERKWGWVEGADPLVRWKDLYKFFSQLQASEVRGDFVQIPATAGNVQLLHSVGLEGPNVP